MDGKKILYWTKMNCCNCNLSLFSTATTMSSLDADGDTAMASASGANNIFNLYQEGLAPNQVLQLCFLRRRAPRRLRLERTRIEDEFVLPRPELKIASLLPLTNIPLEQLVGFASQSTRASSSSSAVEPPPADSALDQARESARQHFLEPRQAAIEDVGRWSVLAESDWFQIHRSMQQPKQQQGQDDERTGLSAAQVPDIADVCWMLEQCHSDAFASFVWDHVLLALLQQCVGSDMSTHQRLFTLLVSYRSLASLSPKDFRAKVRSRNLRQIGDAFGAQAELALVAVYRRQRDSAK